MESMLCFLTQNYNTVSNDNRQLYLRINKEISNIRFQYLKEIFFLKEKNERAKRVSIYPQRGKKMLHFSCLVIIPMRKSEQTTYSFSKRDSVISILKGSFGSICFNMFTNFWTIRHMLLYLQDRNNKSNNYINLNLNQIFTNKNSKSESFRSPFAMFQFYTRKETDRRGEKKIKAYFL